MTMILHCRDAGFDCDAVVRGDSVDEIMAQVRPHAAEAHSLDVTNDVERQLVPLIHTE